MRNNLVGMSAPVARRMNDAVAEEIRVWLVRRRMNQSELARRLGLHNVWVSRRLTSQTDISVDDLARIAAVLEVEASALLPDVRVTLGIVPSDVTRPASYPGAASHPAGSRRPMRLSSVAA